MKSKITFLTKNNEILLDCEREADSLPDLTSYVQLTLLPGFEERYKCRIDKVQLGWNRSNGIDYSGLHK